MAKSKSAKRTTPISTPWEPTDVQCIGVIIAFVGVLFVPILIGNAFLWEDFLYQWYPFRVFAATSMASGEFPLWNPYTFNGMPFFADIQTEVLYLPLTAMTLFVHNGHLSVYWLEVVNILHYVLAGVGMFYLAKSFHLKQLPALFAAVAFALSGFMITHAIHQVIITLVAWYPLILYFFRKSLAHTEWKWVFITALLLGHSFFAGFPQLSLFFYFFLFVFFVFELLTTFGFRGLAGRPAVIMSAKAGSIILLSAGLILIQLLPTMELSQLSVRAEISFQKATEGSMAWRQILTLLIPKLFGTAGAEGFNYWGPGTYWYYWETCMYVGVLPLLLTLLSIQFWKRSKYVAFLLGFGIFSILFALGGNFIVQKFFFYFVPGFSTFRNPSRMVIFLTLGCALLSGFSLQHLLYERKSPDLAKKILLAAGGAAVLCWILVISGALNSALELPNKPQVASFVTTQANIAMLFVVISAAIIYGLLTRDHQMKLLGIAAIVFLGIDLYVFGADQNNSAQNPEEYFKRSGQMVQFLKQQHEIFRVNTRNQDGLLMDRNQGMFDRIWTMEGYTPLVLQRLNIPAATREAQFDLLNTKYITVTDRERKSLQLAPNLSYLPRATMMYNVFAAHSSKEVEDSLKSPAFDYRNSVLIEKEAPFQVRPAATRGAATITNYGNNSISIHVETPADGFLLLSEMYYPGWNGYVDREKTEVYRTDYSLRGLFVRSGTHDVIVRFEPDSFARGMLGTLLTLFVCLGGIVVSEFRSRRTVHPSTGI